MSTFQEMPIADELQRALVHLKFTKPTPVQDAVIPIAIQGKDLMACAETGSGKTAAYGIPMIEKLLKDPGGSALVLAPTRELVQQITDFLRELIVHCNTLKVTAIVGGTDIRKQLRALQKKPRIIVATPGRLTDHLRRKSCNLEATNILVLDEGDRMLDIGFEPQLNEILKFLPKKRQTSLFSATIPHKVRKLSDKYLTDPESIKIGGDSKPVATIKQSVLEVAQKAKNDLIIDELNRRTGSVIVFLRTKRRTDQLARVLMRIGFEVDLIHGGRTQGQRNRAIQNFRDGGSRILCATDVAARGLDIPVVEHVINFDLPSMEEDYVHRIGRTGRNGASGEAVTFVSPEDHSEWNALVHKYKIEGVELKGKGVAKVKPQRNRRGGPSRSRTPVRSSFRADRGKPEYQAKKRYDSDRAPARRSSSDRETEPRRSFRKPSNDRSEAPTRSYSRPTRTDSDRPPSGRYARDRKPGARDTNGPRRESRYSRDKKPEARGTRGPNRESSYSRERRPDSRDSRGPSRDTSYSRDRRPESRDSRGPSRDTSYSRDRRPESRDSRAPRRDSSFSRDRRPEARDARSRSPRGSDSAKRPYKKSFPSDGERPSDRNFSRGPKREAREPNDKSRWESTRRPYKKQLTADFDTSRKVERGSKREPRVKREERVFGTDAQAKRMAKKKPYGAKSEGSRKPSYAKGSTKHTKNPSAKFLGKRKKPSSKAASPKKKSGKKKLSRKARSKA